MTRREERNRKGMIGFFILSLFLNILVYPVMVAREIYQHKKYKIELEKDDIIRYGLVILAGSAINTGVLFILFGDVLTKYIY